MFARRADDPPNLPGDAAMFRDLVIRATEPILRAAEATASGYPPQTRGLEGFLDVEQADLQALLVSQMEGFLLRLRRRRARQ